MGENLGSQRRERVTVEDKGRRSFVLTLVIIMRTVAATGSIPRGSAPTVSTPASSTPRSSSTSPTSLSVFGVSVYIEVDNLLLLAFAVPSFIFGFTNKEDSFLFVFARELLTSPFLAVLGTLVRATEFGGRTKIGAALLKLCTVFVEGLDLLFLGLGNLGFSFSSGGVGGGGVWVLGIGTSSVLNSEFLSTELVLPFTAAIVTTPSLVYFLIGVARRREKSVSHLQG